MVSLERAKQGHPSSMPISWQCASNSFLYGTIAEGREHTAMFGWSADVYDQEKLGVQDISNIIGFHAKIGQGSISPISSREAIRATGSGAQRFLPKGVPSVTGHPGRE